MAFRISEAALKYADHHDQVIEEGKRLGLRFYEHFDILSLGYGGILNLLRTSRAFQVDAIKKHNLFVRLEKGKRVLLLESSPIVYATSFFSKTEIAEEMWGRIPEEPFNALVVELVIKSALNIIT